MKFYKLLKQKKISSEPVCQDADFAKNFILLNGYEPNSFAVEYSPDDYNSILKKNEVFSYFITRNISQLIMTSKKYYSLINSLSKFELKLIDVIFNEDIHGETNELFSAIDSEDKERVVDELNQIVDYFGVSILEFTFSNKKGSKVKVLSNGVIGMDEYFLNEKDLYRFIIDLLNRSSVE